jgi:hypothetical protein
MKSLFALVFLFATCAKPEGTVCPSLPVQPHADIKFNKALTPATYDVEVQLDGDKETCTLTIGPSKPAQEMGAMVMSPMTQTETTCKLIQFAHVRTDGGVDDLRTEKPAGKSEASFSLKMSTGGVVAVDASTTLKFTPTDTLGPGCGRTDVATMNITLK